VGATSAASAKQRDDRALWLQLDEDPAPAAEQGTELPDAANGDGARDLNARDEHTAVEQQGGQRADEHAAPGATAPDPRPREDGPMADAIRNTGGDAPQAMATGARSAELGAAQPAEAGPTSTRTPSVSDQGTHADGPEASAASAASPHDGAGSSTVAAGAAAPGSAPPGAPPDAAAPPGAPPDAAAMPPGAAPPDAAAMPPGAAPPGAAAMPPGDAHTDTAAADSAHHGAATPADTHAGAPHADTHPHAPEGEHPGHEPPAAHGEAAAADAHPAHGEHAAAAPRPPTAPAVGFAESDVERLVPVQPDEPPEQRAQRVAEARQQLAADRAYATGRLHEFTAAQHQRITTLGQLRPQIDLTLGAAEQQAAAQITQASTAQTNAIRAGVASALAQAQAAAATARAQITASHRTTTQAIEASTRSARTQIDASYQQSIAATRAAETRQLGEVGRLYTQAEGAFHAAASTAGSHAVGVAAQRAAAYRSHKINRDDSLLDGPLTDNRCEAQAEAAEKVGQAYRDELAKEGDKQVEQMRLRRPTDDAAVRQIAHEARRNLDTAHAESLRALDQSRQRALDSARRLRNGALAGTAQTLAQTLSSLRQHEQTQLAAVRQEAATQLQAIRQQRTAAAAQLRKGIARAIADLEIGLDRLRGELHRAEVPERAALDQTLAHAEAAIGQELGQLRAGLDQSRGQVTQSLTRAGVTGSQGIVQIGTAAVAAAHQTGSGAAQALAQGAQTASASLQQMLAAHQQQVAASASAAATGNTAITSGVAQAYTQLSGNLQQGMQRNADAVRVGLTDVVDRDMGATITSEAQNAYDQVVPRWQSVVKWVIIIAIVLVVAIVLGPMVIGAVAGLAAGLGASAAVAGVVGAVVGGAIVGAGTAAVTTVVDNAFAGRTGWDLFQGVGTAMAWGALGGALGGGASALLAGPMQGMSALARYGVQVGVDTVLNTGLSLAQGNLSWDNFFSGLAMSMIVNGITAAPRVRSISEGAMSRGYGAGFEGGINIRGRLPGAASPPGPTSISPAQLDHVARGDTAAGGPNAGKWNVRGGGHVPGEIIPRADAEGVPHTTTATDPVTGVSIEQFTRPSGVLQDKSLFPSGTTRADVDVMGNQGLHRALTGQPGTKLNPPTAPNTNGSFTATVAAPNGHPIIIEGFYRPNAAGGFDIQSVFPSTNLKAGTIPVVGGTGLGGSRNVPAPIYIHPPASPDDRDQQ